MAQANGPDKIFEIGLGFWGAKVLLSAVAMGLFTELSRGALEAAAIQERFGLHPRGLRDFLDSLVSMGFLERRDGRYGNTALSETYLNKNKPEYLGGILEMADARLYRFWDSLTTALKTGRPQNEAAAGGDLFDNLYSDPERLKGFLQAMTGLSLMAGKLIAQKFPFARFKTFVDVGAAQGGVPAQIAAAHPHLSGGGFDLPEVGPVFQEYIRSRGLSDRVKFFPGNFMKDKLPEAEVLIMGHILHDWNLEEKKLLLKKAHAALPAGGALIIHEAIIDDERRHNTFGLLMSLNMLIETAGGFDYSGADCRQWMEEAGFKDIYVEALQGPDSMVVGFKA